MTHFIPYSKQSIDEDDIKAVSEVLRSGFITQGPKISEFEDALASYCGAGHAVVFSSGTAALHAAYFSGGLGNSDELITSPITFAATSNASLFLGAIPVFVDIEKDTGNIDAGKIEEHISDKTKMIVPIHYSGHPAYLEKIHKLAMKHDILVVEDACHALGSKYQGLRIGDGTYSGMTVFSFHPVKQITTGEGGAVLTNSREFYEKLILFRTHGITKEHFLHQPDGGWYYEMQHLGYNYRMTDIQAALGTSQLKKLNNFVEKRREIARIYGEAFHDNPYFDTPIEKDYAFSSCHLYPIRLKDGYVQKKREIFSKLKECGIGAQVHYIPVYLHPYYQEKGYSKGLCPSAEDFYKRTISIPIYPAMSDKDVRYVVEKTLSIFDNQILCVSASKAEFFVSEDIQYEGKN
jgi:UDP-4-amino-4,6-dideoxy-L-N-acetyl-beta-L-altrosamine transaminase